MTFLANLALFFLCFLPATLGVGVLGGLYVGTQGVDDFAHQYFVWFAVLLPIVVPCILAVPFVHVANRLVRRRTSRANTRLAMALIMPVGLVAVVLVIWGGAFLSGGLVALVGLPGALYGAALLAPLPKR